MSRLEEPIKQIASLFHRSRKNRANDPNKPRTSGGEICVLQTGAKLVQADIVPVKPIESMSAEGENKHHGPSVNGYFGL